MRLAEQRRWWTSLNAQKMERLIQQAIHHTIQKSLALQIFSTSQTFAHILFVAHSVTGNFDGAGNILFKKIVSSSERHMFPCLPQSRRLLPYGLPHHCQTTGPLAANHFSTSESTAASIRLRLIFMVGVKKPLSIDHGSRATTIILSCS